MKNHFPLGIVLACLTVSLAAPAQADETVFSKGPVFENMGQTAAVETDFVIPKRAKFAIAFDTATPAVVGDINRTLNTAARFMNMHVGAGVKQERIKLAVIVHGKASFDLTSASYYGEKYEGAPNVNEAAIKALTEQGVRVILCGQSAAYHDVKNEDLLPGVEMALSAMTAHAILQQQGYTLNPF
jgi:intracellular sulfur oxidation DsrE/DsrF family protein